MLLLRVWGCCCSTMSVSVVCSVLVPPYVGVVYFLAVARRVLTTVPWYLTLVIHVLSSEASTWNNQSESRVPRQSNPESLVLHES